MDDLGENPPFSETSIWNQHPKNLALAANQTCTASGRGDLDLRRVGFFGENASRKTLLEDHPRTCKWLLTMVSFRPLRIGLLPFQNGRNSWLTNRGDPITTCESWDDPEGWDPPVPTGSSKWLFFFHRIHGTGIFTYIWLIYMVNVGKYTIHGSCGYVKIWLFIIQLKQPITKMILWGERMSSFF